MMKNKKLVKIAIAVVSLAVIAVGCVVLFFPKEKIRTIAQQKATEAAGVPVNIGGIQPHFFPLGISLTNIEVGKESVVSAIPYVSLKELAVGVELFPLFRKQIHINYILLDRPKIVVHQSKEKVPAQRKPTKDEANKNASQDFSLTLSNLRIKEGEVKIIDEKGKESLEVAGIEETLSASLTGASEINLEGKLFIAKLLVYSSAGTFGQGVTLKLDKKINYKQKEDLLTIERGDVEFAHLPLSLSGTVDGVTAENKKVNLSLKGGPANVKSILGFLPMKMFPQMEGVSSQGDLSIEAAVKGLLSSKEGPVKSLESKALDFSAKLELTHGKLSYPKLPKPIEGIEILVSANPSEVSISKFFVKTELSQVSLSGKISQYLKTPSIDIAAKIQADLAEAQLMQPKNGTMQLGGKVFVDAKVKGTAEKPAGSGKLELKSVMFEDKSMGIPAISNLNGTMTLDTQAASIQSLHGSIGKSDFQVNGKVSDYTTKPNFDFSLKSVQLYLDELMPKPAPKDPNQKTDLSVLDKVNGTISVSAQKVAFNKMDMKNVVGKAYLKDSVFDLREFSIGIFGGAIKLSGLANFKNVKAPKFDFQLGVQKIQAGDMLSYASNLNQFGKLAGFLTGNMSTNVSFQGELDENLNLNMSKLTSKGVLDVADTKVSNHPVQNQLASLLGASELKSISLQNWTQPFEIKEGKLNISDMKLGNKDMQLKVNGWQALDGTTKMALDMDLPQKWASGIKRQIPEQMQGLLFDGSDSKIQLPLEVSGHITSPSLGLNQGKMTAALENKLKSKLQGEQQKLQQQASDKAQELLKNKNPQDQIKKAFKKLF